MHKSEKATMRYGDIQYWIFNFLSNIKNENPPNPYRSTQHSN